MSARYRADTLVDGLAFPEGPRWHADRFWFTDQHARCICAVAADGSLQTIATTDDLPGGLGWLRDGTLLVVYMTQRRVMRLTADGLQTYADLSGLASFHCNDMLVDDQDRVYVGNFGYDLHGGAALAPAELVRIDPDGRATVFADDLVFPNGCALQLTGQPAGARQLLVAETFAHRISRFALDDAGNATGRTVWADLGEATPDGICLDAQGALWVASPGTGTLIRVQQGGAILDRCTTRGTPYACMLGGPERRTLFACTAETDDPDEARRRRSGRIEQARVEVPGSGLP